MAAIRKNGVQGADIHGVDLSKDCKEGLKLG
jgi:hypothetical protein